MSAPPTVGMMLRTSDPFARGMRDPAADAARCESLGFDGVWVGDHLSFNVPWLDAAASTVAAVVTTERITVGHNVLLTSLRPAAWVAKHVATLQHLAPGRFVLGVGVGGENPLEWAAVGRSTADRGARTDALLAALPSLLSGQPVVIAPPEDVSIPALVPACEPPPIWVGGRSEAALRRTIRYGAGWIGVFLSGDQLRRHVARLEELADEADRQRPQIGVTVVTSVADRRADAAANAEAFVGRQYGMPRQVMERYAAYGTTDDVVDQLRALHEAGATNLALQGCAPDAEREYGQLAVVRERLLDDIR